MLQEIRLRVLKKRRETARTSSLLLEPVGGPLPYRAGQFLTLLFDELGPMPIRRSYSLSSCPGVDEQLTLTVKKQVNGLVSRYLVDRVQAGDTLRALPPAGQFTLPRAGAPRQVVLFGGGSGITPLFGLLKDVLHHHPSTRVLMLNANRSEDHIIFREALTRYARSFAGRFDLRHFLSMPRDSVHTLREQLAPADLRWGRLSNALMETALGTFAAQAPHDTLFYLCGPPSLLLKAREVLGYLGYKDDHIYRELFTIRKPYRPRPEQYPDATVEIRDNGTRHAFPVAAGQTILEAAEAARLALPYSCRSGSCTTCSAQCLAGKVEMFTPDGRIDTEASGGEVLTCVGYPLTQLVVLRLASN